MQFPSTVSEQRQLLAYGGQVAETDTMIVRLAFLEPKSDDYLINRFVAWTGKHYVSHVEILFHDNMAASINAEGEVFWKHRNYSSNQYKVLSIEVSSANYKLMYNYAYNMSKNKIGFSNFKMFCGPLTGYRGSSDSTFCSEFVTHTLQVGGVDFAMKMNASSMTPSGLYEFMLKNRHICFDSTAFKLGVAFG